jgi:hypothetical protein
MYHLIAKEHDGQVDFLGFVKGEGVSNPCVPVKECNALASCVTEGVRGYNPLLTTFPESFFPSRSLRSE